MVCFGTTLVVAALSSAQLGNGNTPSIRSIALLLLAGCVNGTAVYFYSAKATDPMIPTAVFVVVVSTLMVVCAPLLSWAIVGNIPTGRQTIGFGFAIATIYFLASK